VENLSKEDKKYLAHLNASERQAAVTRYHIFLTYAFLLLSIMISLISIILSQSSLASNATKILVAGVAILFVIPVLWLTRQAKQQIQGAKEFEELSRQYLESIYPGYVEKRP